MRASQLSGFALIFALLTFETASATPFDFVRIGDQDGFGFVDTGTLQAANGTPADTDGNGRLQQTEFLPDLNFDGATQTRDNFDNRSYAERKDTGGTSGNGFTDQGSNGFKWTDIGLSTKYIGIEFPDPNGPARPNNPTFEFRFHVGAESIIESSAIYFNLVFGDYDVRPANVDLTFLSAPARSIELEVQNRGNDGLIQAATSTLQFHEVFTLDEVSGWYGLVIASFDSPNEPYTSFDYAELAVEKISFTPVPESGTLAILGFGLFGLALLRTCRPGYDADT